MQIWSFAEVGYQETQSSALLQEQLKAAGFTVVAGVAEIPTAFTATWGSGKPVIGIVGEFDALAGPSQAAAPDRKPLVAEGPGHGCGHHLFGTASTAAAIAVKEWLAATKRGRNDQASSARPPKKAARARSTCCARALRRCGCGGVVASGRSQCAERDSTLANVTGKFRFRGVSAHASGGTRSRPLGA